MFLGWCMNELALFAGAGGGILGGRLLGWSTVCAVEFDAYARSVLLARQRDGCLDRFPIWDDVRTFDGKPWRGSVDVISGGFPCQDISTAGKGAGITGDRSGLWREFARIIREVGPHFVFVENSPALTSRGLGVVLGDLAALGYDAEWGVLGADDAGAPHIRKRIWILAYTTKQHGPELRSKAPKFRCGSKDVAHAIGDGLERKFQRWSTQRAANRSGDGCGSGWWASEPDVGRVADGVAARVDRLRCVGNGQVPIVAALAWRILGGP